ASLAELERKTIADRTNQGRTRVAKTGKWLGGVVPLGYDLDADGCLVPSERVVAQVGVTEAELARDVLRRGANGSSSVAEAARLTALKAPCERRYAGGRAIPAPAGLWRSSRLNYMVKNPVYAGRHVYRATTGEVERAVPALVDEATWRRAAA